MRTRFGRFVRFTLTLGFALGIGAWQASAQVADYTYTTNNGTITITKYIGPGGAVEIPSIINGLPVTSIRLQAFWMYDSLTSVTITDSVTSIGDYSFGYCTSLTNVTIGNSVTNIQGGAFYYCTNLVGVAIPNSVTSIGSEAFFGCKSLTSVTIPSSTTNIGFAAFDACDSLTEITADALSSFYSSVDGVLFNKSQTTLIQFPEARVGGYTVSNSVTTIGDAAFAGCSLTWVTLPNSVTSIGYLAFDSCTSLVSVAIPNSVTNIGGGAFYYCTSLTNITIGNSVTSIQGAAFYYCTNLVSVAIPNSVTSIGQSTFAYCFSLTAITVDALNTAYSSVDGVLFDKRQTTLIQCPAGKPGSYAIPNGVIFISSLALTFCVNLTSVTIPASVGNIGDEAFSACSNLTSVTIGSSGYFGSGVFTGCPKLTGAYFTGDAPFINTPPYRIVFTAPTIVYYLPGRGWDTTFGGVRTALWKPRLETSGSSFGVRTNQFGFNINWASGMTAVVEASTKLANPGWVPVSTNTLTDGWSYFSDPEWTNYPARFYRVRSP